MVAIKFIKSTKTWKVKVPDAPGGSITFPDEDMDMLLAYLEDRWGNWFKLNREEHIAWFSDEMYDDYFDILIWVVKNYRINKDIVKRAKHRKVKNARSKSNRGDSGWLVLEKRIPNEKKRVWTDECEERYQHNLRVAISRGRYDIFNQITKEKRRLTGQPALSGTEMYNEFERMKENRGK